MERGKKVDASRVLLHQVFSLQLNCLIEHTQEYVKDSEEKKNPSEVLVHVRFLANIELLQICFVQ